ncbi:MAG: hypothetical protein MUD08_03900 [Cytophagales bacterium]|jgi:hypothetical protein|nr:hypothetical protein [Cytophagales bacterium]
MKKTFLLLSLLCCATLVYAQTKPKAKSKAKATPAKAAAAPSASVSSAALYQKWVHSFEDEKGQPGVEVYRPEGFAFPPARGRKGLKIGKDGMLVRFDIAPNDGEKVVMGRWERTKLPNTMKVTVQGAESEAYFLEVVSVGKDMLKVRRKSEI